MGAGLSSPRRGEDLQRRASGGPRLFQQAYAASEYDCLIMGAAAAVAAAAGSGALKPPPQIGDAASFDSAHGGADAALHRLRRRSGPASTAPRGGADGGESQQDGLELLLHRVRPRRQPLAGTGGAWRAPTRSGAHVQPQPSGPDAVTSQAGGHAPRGVGALTRPKPASPPSLMPPALAPP
jgi:hypothetical protein